MASVLGKSNSHNEDDDEEDLEALRLAALKTLRKKQIQQTSSVPTAVFQPHFGNPNLIAIIPEGAQHQLVNQWKVSKQHFRHPPIRPQPFRPQNSTSTIGSTLKVLPQVQIDDGTATTQREKGSNEKEEVSTKFSRYEDTESESDDESETEKNESESSDEPEDILALEDDDDSLEALMAQMEHEIEVGIDPEPTKKDKKKKINKKDQSKDKETKIRSDDKTVTEKFKSETKTAVIEPTIKEAAEVNTDKVEQRQDIVLSTVRSKSPVKIHPLKENCSVKNTVNLGSTERKSPLRRSQSPTRSCTPSKHKSPTNSPKRSITPTTRIINKSKSPYKNRSCSPRRSPFRSKSPVLKKVTPSRQKSPRKLTPDRSSLARSPNKYFSGNKSPSPYYKAKGRDYTLVHRSRSPIRRRSHSPRKDSRDLSPKYYQRRSQSPRSPVWRPKSPSPRYRSRSPLRRRSLSPRKKKYIKPAYVPHSPSFYISPKRRSPSISPRRSPPKRDYSPRRRQPSPKREFRYRRSSLSPKRKRSPPFKKYSSFHSPKYTQRSLSPRGKISPRRRNSPVGSKESRVITNHRSRTPSLSLSPSPSRHLKDPPIRYNSPLRVRKENAENMTILPSRARLDYTPENKSNSGDNKEKKKSYKSWDREREIGRKWEKKIEDKRKERSVKHTKKECNQEDQLKKEELKEETTGHQLNNPVFEARRKKFESTVLIEPASKKICLVNKKNNSVEERVEVEGKVQEEKKIVENSEHTEDEMFSGHEEIDEIDNFLNEDVLDLSAEVWSSDDDLFPKISKTNPEKSSTKTKLNTKCSSNKEHHKLKGKTGRRKSKVAVSTTPEKSKVSVKKSKRISPKAPSPFKKTHSEKEEKKDRDDSDLRAELSRRREERLTKAGSLHEKLPARLLQSAFESALGTKKSKKEEKAQKTGSSNKEAVSPVHKDKSDGRRVLVLKRPAPVRMQSAHINVTFPKDGGSDSESSYTSSSSEERYTVSSAKRKLPVYMRLGTVQRERSSGRKVKLHSRRSQNPVLYVPIPRRVYSGI